MKYNKNFDNVENEYIFSKIRKLASAYNRPDFKLIDLGVGDVKLPLFKQTVSAMKKACDEMQDEYTFKGYPPANGYQFLRDKIAKNYQILGANIDADEIFITDGAKGQLGNIAELFDNGVNVLYQSPCYPAGAESNLLRGNNVDYLVTHESEDFIPYPPLGKNYDLI